MPRLSSLNSPKPKSKKPTFIFSSIPSSIDEGSNVTFNIATTNVPNNTILYWTIQTNSGDFGTISGSFTITDNVGSFIVTPTADITTEGNETFTIAIRIDSITGKIVATSNTITINDTSITEPGSIVYVGNTNTTTTAATQTTYTWTVPAGVTNISYVVIGAGAGGGLASFTGAISSGGGGGGGTAYRNNVTVTPGQTITVVAGDGGFGKSVSAYNSTVTAGYKGGDGGASSLNTKPGFAGFTTTGTGGTGANLNTLGGATGSGGYPSGVYDGGGNGGNGGNGYGGGGGGGGGMSTAPSTTGRGGQGGTNPGAGATGGTNGSGGGGGGGAHGTYSRGTGGYVKTGGYGGGGAAQTDGVFATASDGSTGLLAWRHDSVGPSLKYGGGGGATYTVSTTAQTLGAYANSGLPGAIRIIWPGSTRQFPSTNVWVQNNSGTWV